MNKYHNFHKQLIFNCTSQWTQRSNDIWTFFLLRSAKAERCKYSCWLNKFLMNFHKLRHACKLRKLWTFCWTVYIQYYTHIFESYDNIQHSHSDQNLMRHKWRYAYFEDGMKNFTWKNWRTSVTLKNFNEESFSSSLAQPCVMILCEKCIENTYFLLCLTDWVFRQNAPHSN